jgi:N-acetylglutamate synthase-like GNAT family acetyltransferase
MQLHVHLKALHECTDGIRLAASELLDEQWAGRNHERMVRRSCASLPCYLALLERERDVVGHVAVLRVVGDERSVIVESVVVARVQRGRGFGRVLMALAEQWIVENVDGVQCVYLSTRDRQGFYEHLGYEPIDYAVSAVHTGVGDMHKRLEALQLKRGGGSTRSAAGTTHSWYKKSIVNSGNW